MAMYKNKKNGLLGAAIRGGGAEGSKGKGKGGKAKKVSYGSKKTPMKKKTMSGY